MSTKQTTTSHLKSLNTKKKHVPIEMHILARVRQNNVVGHSCFKCKVNLFILVSVLGTILYCFIEYSRFSLFDFPDGIGHVYNIQ